MYGNRHISKKTYLEKKESPQRRKKRNTRIKKNNNNKNIFQIKKEKDEDNYIRHNNSSIGTRYTTINNLTDEDSKKKSKKDKKEKYNNSKNKTIRTINNIEIKNNKNITNEKLDEKYIKLDEKIIKKEKTEITYNTRYAKKTHSMNMKARGVNLDIINIKKEKYEDIYENRIENKIQNKRRSSILEEKNKIKNNNIKKEIMPYNKIPDKDTEENKRNACQNIKTEKYNSKSRKIKLLDNKKNKIKVIMDDTDDENDDEYNKIVERIKGKNKNIKRTKEKNIEKEMDIKDKEKSNGRKEYKNNQKSKQRGNNKKGYKKNNKICSLEYQTEVHCCYNNDLYYNKDKTMLIQNNQNNFFSNGINIYSLRSAKYNKNLINENLIKNYRYTANDIDEDLYIITVNKIPINDKNIYYQKSNIEILIKNDYNIFDSSMELLGHKRKRNHQKKYEKEKKEKKENIKKERKVTKKEKKEKKKIPQNPRNKRYNKDNMTKEKVFNNEVVQLKSDLSYGVKKKNKKGIKKHNSMKKKQGQKSELIEYEKEEDNDHELGSCGSFSEGEKEYINIGKKNNKNNKNNLNNSKPINQIKNNEQNENIPYYNLFHNKIQDNINNYSPYSKNTISNNNYYSSSYKNNNNNNFYSPSRKNSINNNNYYSPPRKNNNNNNNYYSPSRKNNNNNNICSPSNKINNNLITNYSIREIDYGSSLFLDNSLNYSFPIDYEEKIQIKEDPTYISKNSRYIKYHPIDQFLPSIPIDKKRKYKTRSAKIKKLIFTKKENNMLIDSDNDITDFTSYNNENENNEILPILTIPRIKPIREEHTKIIKDKLEHEGIHIYQTDNEILKKEEQNLYAGSFILYDEKNNVKVYVPCYRDNAKMKEFMTKKNLGVIEFQEDNDIDTDEEQLQLEIERNNEALINFMKKIEKDKDYVEKNLQRKKKE